MEAFWGITLSIIVLYKWLRSETAKPDPHELRRNTVKARWDRKRIKNDKLKQEEAMAQKNDNERRKRKQAEELITVIIPTISNDGK